MFMMAKIYKDKKEAFLCVFVLGAEVMLQLRGLIRKY